MKSMTSGLAIGAVLVSCFLAGCDLNVANEGDHDNVETTDSHDTLNGDTAIEAGGETNAVATNVTEVAP